MADLDIESILCTRQARYTLYRHTSLFPISPITCSFPQPSLAMGHHTGFFKRPFQDWTIEDYIHYMRRTYDQIHSRDITGTWLSTLRSVAKCSKTKCCPTKRRARASELLSAYHQKGRSSDKATAARLLKTASRQLHVETMNISSSVIGNSNTVVAPSGSIVNSTIAPTDSTITHGANERPPATPEHPPDHDEEADGFDEEFDEESDGMSPVPDLDDVFRTSYLTFKSDLKWKLPSGSTVEDILYDAYFNKNLRPSVRNSIRNWVVDLSSEKMQTLFSESDWAAIKAEVPPLPDVDRDFVRSLTRFAKVKTTADLRNVVESTSYKSKDVIYDRARHFDSEWAELVIRHLLVLYEDEEMPLRGKHLEDWYCYNVWSHIIDDCFRSLRHVTLERREVICQSSALRKNRDRTEASSRMKSGPRLDGIVRSVDDDSHEFCGIEAAPRLRGGTSSTKWLNDNAKLQKVLRDMLSALAAAVAHERRVVKRLQVVGISTAGLACQVSRMCHRAGYVCIFTKDPLNKIPDHMGQFKQLLLFLAAFAQVKGVLEESIEAFRNRLQMASDDDDDEAFSEKLMNVSRANDNSNIATLPRPSDSP